MSDSARTGFLWDSLSQNTGDQTVGLTLMRLARQAGAPPLEGVEIGSAPLSRYDLLVVGGGELLHPAGHPYYDLFRVSGEHILNTVGTYGAVEASHLSSYRLVSVRSRADRENLQGYTGEVRVVPCLTVLFDRVARPTEMADLPRRALGFHLHPGSVAPPGTLDALSRIVDRHGGPVAFVPYTHYNRDGLIQGVLARSLGLPPPLSLTGPDQAFAVIRRLAALVVSSLHGTIMAYVAGVPFLSLAYAPKVTHFLQERQLGHRAIRALSEAEEKADLLEPDTVDWEDALAADQGLAASLAEAIFSELDRVPSGRRPQRGRAEGWAEPSHPREAHAAMMAVFAEHGQRVADKLAWDLEIQRARSHLRDLEGRLAIATKSRDEVQRRLDQALNEAETERAARARQGRELEETVTGLQRAADGARAHIHKVETELDLTRREARSVASRLADATAGVGHTLPVPRIHAVTVHHRGACMLQACLQSLLCSRRVELQIVVVANACGEPLPEIVGRAPIQVVRSEQSIGFSEANNLGVAWARENLGEPDFYFFLNNDTVVDPDALAGLVAEMLIQPRAGIAGPRLMILGAEDHINSLGLNVTAFGEAWDEGIGRPLASYGPVPERREVLAVTGSALLIRASTLTEVNGWTELYGFYLEDIDLCLKAWSLGWAVHHVPDALVLHAVSATSDETVDFKRLLSWRNRFVLLLTHWPLGLLLRVGPPLALRETAILAARLRHRAFTDARLQLRSWLGALALLPAVLSARRRRPWREPWTRFLRRPGTVPVITLPADRAGAQKPQGREGGGPEDLSEARAR